MVLGAMTIFFTSLAGIAALFVIKLWEERKQYVFAARFRGALDTLALRIKWFLIAGEELLSRLPSLTTFIAMHMLAFCAVWFARLARRAAEAAHRLADFVSPKHNFERRETRSDFLKQVSEHRVSNGEVSNHNTPVVSTGRGTVKKNGKKISNGGVVSR